jgi:hypothetical protein
VRWEHFPEPAYDTWEPLENLDGAEDAVETYLKTLAPAAEEAGEEAMEVKGIY